MTPVEIRAIFAERMAHADKIPVVIGQSGDRNPITVEHEIMDQVLAMTEFQAPAWNKLLQFRTRNGVSGVSTEYPGLWIRACVFEFDKMLAPKPARKGGE